MFWKSKAMGGPSFSRAFLLPFLPAELGWPSRENSPAGPSSMAAWILPRPNPLPISSTPEPKKALKSPYPNFRAGLRSVIDGLIDGLTDELARLEASIDFTEDDGGLLQDDALPARLRTVVGELEALGATYDQGRLYRDGVSIVIAGRANVGKSSLLNRLFGGKRAIVTSIPGTTRDFIEESIDLYGMPVRITDTAGIRPTDNDIEQAGIDLVWERIETADAVVVLMDGSEPLTGEDRCILERAGVKPVIPVVNKADLPRVLQDEEIVAAVQRLPVWISAKNGAGIDELKGAIRDHFLQDRGDAGMPAAIIANVRCRSAIQKAVTFLEQAVETASAGGAPELVSSDIRDALDRLGEIGGKTLNDDVLDRIFSSFCIGK